MRRSDVDNEVLLGLLKVRTLVDRKNVQNKLIKDLSDSEIMLSSEALREKLEQNARYFGNYDVGTKKRIMRSAGFPASEKKK